MSDQTDGLLERIEHGTTTERDARIVARLVARMMRYESALRQVAIHGTGEAAMLATRALTEDDGGRAVHTG